MNSRKAILTAFDRLLAAVEGAKISKAKLIEAAETVEGEIIRLVRMAGIRWPDDDADEHGVRDFCDETIIVLPRGWRVKTDIWQMDCPATILRQSWLETADFLQICKGGMVRCKCRDQNHTAGHTTKHKAALALAQDVADGWLDEVAAMIEARRTEDVDARKVLAAVR